MAGVGTISEATFLSTLILGLAGTIRQVGNDWYKWSAEWERFPRRVEELREKVKLWETEARKRGLTPDAGLLQSLRYAKLVLEEEERNLQSRVARAGPGRIPRTKTAMFPAKLELSIHGAIDALNHNFSETVRLHEEAKSGLDRKSFAEPFVHDSRYVRLERTEAEVCRVLNDLSGPMVGLLHGGAGTGKTWLGRSVAAHYATAEQRRFDQVFFLSCDADTKVEDVEFELIQRLGSVPAASIQEHEKIRSIPLRRQIVGLLKSPRVLIILDDVSDGDLMMNFVQLCGDGVRCLVTSRHPSLCRILDPSTSVGIEIENLELGAARKILANHVGFVNHRIPPHLQEVADRMVAEMAFNPLALASLANDIDHQSNALEDWEHALTHFVEALRAGNFGILFHGKYLERFWSATRSAMDGLREDSQHALLLLEACEGCSIPEEIIHILYTGLWDKPRDSSVSSVATVRKELESRQLVQITTGEATVWSRNVCKRRRWSTHSLHKLFMKVETSNEARSSLLSALVAKERAPEVEEECDEESANVEETDLVMALCALYLQNRQEFVEFAAAKMSVPCERFNHMRRTAIEPIALLLGRSWSERWTEADHARTRKVFLTYVFHGRLDDASISYMLRWEFTVSAMSKALHSIVMLESEACLLDQSAHGLMTILLLWLVDGKVAKRKQEYAAGVISHLTCKPDRHGMFIVSYQGVMEGVVRSLETSSSVLVRTSCATTLVNLTGGADEIQSTIINFPNALRVLLDLLSNEPDQELQMLAARALFNLANAGETIKLELVNNERLLSELIKSTSTHGSKPKGSLQMREESAMALCSLACGGEEVEMKLVSHPRLLSRLAEILHGDPSPKLQEIAATTIFNLAHGGHYVQFTIVDHPLLLSELLNSLSKSSNPKLQENCAMAVCSLACGAEAVEVKLASHPRVIYVLLSSMFNGTNSVLQEVAAKALSNLARGGRETKVAMVAHPQLLSKVADSTSKPSNPKVQEYSLQIMSNLAQGSDMVRVDLLNNPRVLSMLLHSMAREANPQSQAIAAKAFLNLACGNDMIKIKLLTHPRVLSELVNSLIKTFVPSIQGNQIGVMTASNANTERDNSESIIAMGSVNDQKVLSRLVDLLRGSQLINPGLQEYVTMALARLARVEDNVILANHVSKAVNYLAGIVANQ